MTATRVDKSHRSSHFPAIEKRYGEPMKFWFNVMKKLEGQKYPEQIAHLRENYGFSQAHANALVMYARGSTTSKRYSSLDGFLKTLDPVQKKTVKAIFSSIKKKYPHLELVMAWNKPMLKNGETYIFGVATAKNHILLAPFDSQILKRLEKKLIGYQVNKKTIRVPVDWKIDSPLLNSMIREAISKQK